MGWTINRMIQQENRMQFCTWSDLSAAYKVIRNDSLGLYYFDINTFNSLRLVKYLIWVTSYPTTLCPAVVLDMALYTWVSSYKPKTYHPLPSTGLRQTARPKWAGDKSPSDHRAMYTWVTRPEQNEPQYRFILFLFSWQYCCYQWVQCFLRKSLRAITIPSRIIAPFIFSQHSSCSIIIG
jgi:hypothetical protein